jgi:hypothetical protein
MKHKVNSANTTPPPKGSCMEESNLTHWNHSWVPCLIIPWANCFSFAQVMAFLESVSKWGASTSEIIIASVVNWKQLSMFSRSVLCILQSETTWEKFFSEFDPEILLDTKKGLGAVVKFLDFLPQLLCWWFAWLEQLVEVLLSVNLWYRFTGCYVSQVSLNTWNLPWRIRCYRMFELKIRADTATLPVS